MGEVLLPPAGDRPPSLWPVTLALTAPSGCLLARGACRGPWPWNTRRVQVQGREGPQHRHSARSCWGPGQTPPRLTQLSTQDSQLRPASWAPLSSPPWGRASLAESATYAIPFPWSRFCLFPGPWLRAVCPVNISVNISCPLRDWQHFPLISNGGRARAGPGQEPGGGRHWQDAPSGLCLSICWPQSPCRDRKTVGFSGQERGKWEACPCLSAWPKVHELCSAGPWLWHLVEGLMLPGAPVSTNPWPCPHVGVSLTLGELGWSSLCGEGRSLEVSASVFPQGSSSSFLGYFARGLGAAGRCTGARAVGVGHVPTKGRAEVKQQKLQGDCGVSSQGPD